LARRMSRCTSGGPAATATLVAPAVNNSRLLWLLCADDRPGVSAVTSIIITAHRAKHCQPDLLMHVTRHTEQRGVSKRSIVLAHRDCSFGASTGPAATDSAVGSSSCASGPSAGLDTGLLAVASSSLFRDPAIIASRFARVAGPGLSRIVVDHLNVRQAGTTVLKRREHANCQDFRQGLTSQYCIGPLPPTLPI
jgi:hypothetical protein